MSLQNVIALLGKRPDLMAEPPVLVDIGASIGLSPRWRAIAPLCVCLAFDADERDFNYVTRTDLGYRRLHVVNKIVVDRAVPARQPFHLTHNPHCSSLLEPDPNHLNEYVFAPAFAVERVAELETVELAAALQKVGLNYIDWFKVDSQGIDLRLFSSLPDDIQRHCAVLDFEPGLIDAYHGEGSLADVLNHVGALDYFMVEFVMRRTIRLQPPIWREIFGSWFAQKAAESAVPSVPGWCEITWMNHRTEAGRERDWIVSWLFAMALDHPELAASFARRGGAYFRDPIFALLRSEADRALRRRLWRPRHVADFAIRALRKVLKQ